MNNKKYVFGKKAVIEAFNEHKINEIYVLNNSNYLKEFDKKIPIKIKDKSFFHEFKNINHQNIIGLLNEKTKIKIHENIDTFLELAKTEDKKIILILDEIQDPGNFGSICRTVNALGINSIIYKKDNQVQINETVIKTSLGSVYNIDFYKTTNLSKTIDILKKNNFWILSTSLSEKSIELSDFKTKFDYIALVVGNEEKGVSKLIQEKSDINLKIKMESNMQSLNVSVATGIFLHYLKNMK